MPLSKSPLESTWLYHEIGRCHLELGNYEKAKEYGEKSLASAQEADDPVWQLNATVLIAQAEGRLYHRLGIKTSTPCLFSHIVMESCIYGTYIK